MGSNTLSLFEDHLQDLAAANSFCKYFLALEREHVGDFFVGDFCGTIHCSGKLSRDGGERGACWEGDGDQFIN